MVNGTKQSLGLGLSPHMFTTREQQLSILYSSKMNFIIDLFEYMLIIIIRKYDQFLYCIYQVLLCR